MSEQNRLIREALNLVQGDLSVKDLQLEGLVTSSRSSASALPTSAAATSSAVTTSARSPCSAKAANKPIRMTRARTIAEAHPTGFQSSSGIAASPVTALTPSSPPRLSIDVSESSDDETYLRMNSSSADLQHPLSSSSSSVSFNFDSMPISSIASSSSTTKPSIRRVHTSALDASDARPRQVPAVDFFAAQPRAIPTLGRQRTIGELGHRGVEHESHQGPPTLARVRTHASTDGRSPQPHTLLSKIESGELLLTAAAVGIPVSKVRSVPTAMTSPLERSQSSRNLRSHVSGLSTTDVRVATPVHIGSGLAVESVISKPEFFDDDDEQIRFSKHRFSDDDDAAFYAAPPILGRARTVGQNPLLAELLRPLPSSSTARSPPRSSQSSPRNKHRPPLPRLRSTKSQKNLFATISSSSPKSSSSSVVVQDALSLDSPDPERTLPFVPSSPNTEVTALSSVTTARTDHTFPAASNQSHRRRRRSSISSTNADSARRQSISSVQSDSHAPFVRRGSVASQTSATGEGNSQPAFRLTHRRMSLGADRDSSDSELEQDDSALLALADAKLKRPQRQVEQDTAALMKSAPGRRQSNVSRTMKARIKWLSQAQDANSEQVSMI